MTILVPLPPNKLEKSLFLRLLLLFLLILLNSSFIMAHYHSTSSIQTTIRFCLLFSLLVGMVSAQLSSNFYATSCPNALSTIKTAVDSAVSSENRMGASLLRLHFHDCFVNASPSLSLSLSCFKDIFKSNV